MDQYKVIVVEDEPLIRENIVTKIHSSNSQFHVTCTASNGLEAWEQIQENPPDLLITDIQMPIMDGLELLAKVKKSYPEIECVILTGYNEFEYARQAMKIGIQEYLLKPLKPKQTEEVLKTVELHLTRKRSNIERDIVVSKIHGSASSDGLPSNFKNARFTIFLISLGHLCRQFSCWESVQIFQNSWEKADLPEFLEKHSSGNSKWWIIDDKQPNQKFLILSFPAEFKIDFRESGRNLLCFLKTQLNPMIVNICTTNAVNRHNEIWSVSQKNRLYLSHNLRIGQSLYFETNVEQSDSPADSEQREIGYYQDILLNLISSNNRHALAQELKKLCQYWDETAVFQHIMEKQLFQLIEMSYNQFLGSSDAEVLHLEYEFGEKLAPAPNLMGIFEYVLEIFDTLLQVEESDIYAPEELVRRIRTFIEQNYTSPISLETIAQSFHFNSSYLTKIFKKYEGETPLKYIIELRIEKAKVLMNTQPALSIKDICGNVGYYDQHYFSRIFKNITGHTPSEYRKLILEKHDNII